MKDVNSEIDFIAKELKADSGDIEYYLNIFDFFANMEDKQLTQKQIDYLNSIAYNAVTIRAFDAAMKKYFKTKESALKANGIKLKF